MPLHMSRLVYKPVAELFQKSAAAHTLATNFSARAEKLVVSVWLVSRWCPGREQVRAEEISEAGWYQAWLHCGACACGDVTEEGVNAGGA